MPDKPLSPPSISIKLIKLLCKKELSEEIEGNLIERYLLLNEGQKSFILIRYWYEVFNYIRPYFLKSLKLKTTTTMFIFNPKITIRNLIRHRVSTFISLFGFIIGLTSFTFLYFYLDNELNYDAFHAEKDSIYRVYRTSQDESGEYYDIAVSSPPFARALKNDYPNKIQSTLRVSFNDMVVKYEDKRFSEDKIMIADTNFFEFFTYPLLRADPETVLDNVFNVVMSEPLSKKYFGEEDPIGKRIELNGNADFVVAGIFTAPKNKTHLEFDMVLSMGLYEGQEWFENWWRNFAYTYIKINPEDEAYLQSAFSSFMEKYLGDDFKRTNNNNGLKIVPLADVHFHQSRYDSTPIGNFSSVIIIASVAIAILFIACFNYINLSIAQLHKRAKEVGVRKVLGVDKTRLTVQFLGESTIILTLASTLSVILSTVLRGYFNHFFGLSVTYNWSDPAVQIFFSSLLILLIITSGLYPALTLSSFETLKVLRTDKPLKSKNIFVRKGLIIVQFSISMFLIITTALIYFQLEYMNSKNLGYNPESVLIIDTDREIRANYDEFKSRLLAYEDIKSITTGSGVPSGFHDTYGLTFSEGAEDVRVHTVFADIDYLNTFNIPVMAGRGFSLEYASDSTDAMMINEAAWKATGLSKDEIIGKKVRIPFRDWDRTVIGIFENYHFKALRDAMDPQAIIMGEDMRRIAIKIDSEDRYKTLSIVEELYKELAPSFTLNSWFLTDDLRDQYQSENEQAKVFTVFSCLSIVLACIGILGLASFAAQKRQKELSIRKVLGASISQVITLISAEFFTLVMIAVILSIPLACYFMSIWLQDYAYRIELLDYWMVFVIAGITTMVIALLTIILKTYKTASGNPVDTIRYE
ncbi:MAG: FtsX-like permease family protein [Bacteroidota bacterium]